MQLLLLRNALICNTTGATKNIAKMVVQNSNFVSSSANVGITYKQIYLLTANVYSLSMLVTSLISCHNIFSNIIILIIYNATFAQAQLFANGALTLHYDTRYYNLAIVLRLLPFFADFFNSFNLSSSVMRHCTVNMLCECASC